MHTVANALDHHDALVLKTELPYVVYWRGQVHVTPAAGVLTAWVLYGVSETPAGEACEMDHPDSWLVLVGLL